MICADYFVFNETSSEFYINEYMFYKKSDRKAYYSLMHAAVDDLEISTEI